MALPPLPCIQQPRLDTCETHIDWHRFSLASFWQLNSFSLKHQSNMTSLGRGFKIEISIQFKMTQNFRLRLLTNNSPRSHTQVFKWSCFKIKQQWQPIPVNSFFESIESKDHDSWTWVQAQPQKTPQAPELLQQQKVRRESWRETTNKLDQWRTN